MMQAIFGQPEAARVMTEEHAQLLEHATYIARALQTLECLREWGRAEGDDLPSLFVHQTYRELKRMEAYYREQGIRPREIDFGAFV